MTATECLQHLLQPVNTNNLPDLFTFVSRSHDISSATFVTKNADKLDTNFQRGAFSNDAIQKDPKDVYDTESSDGDDIDHDALPVNPLLGIPPLIANTNQNPADVHKHWNRPQSLPHGLAMQADVHLKYVSDCKTFGINSTNRNLDQMHLADPTLTLSTGPLIDQTENQVITPDLSEFFELKRNMFRACRTSEQQEWIQDVCAYLEVYYSSTPTDVDDELISICSRNPILLTNAPGGCGKSWLIQKLTEFVTNFCLNAYLRTYTTTGMTQIYERCITLKTTSMHQLRVKTKQQCFLAVSDELPYLPHLELLPATLTVSLFMAPFAQIRFHIQHWSPIRPQTCWSALHGLFFRQMRGHRRILNDISDPTGLPG